MTTPTRLSLLLLALVLTSLGPACSATAQDAEWERVVDLRGHWLFQLGDDPDWARPGHDDRGWDSIYAPARWEDEGYPGLDGVAWYRLHVTVPRSAKNTVLYLHLGRIDDADEVYLNGYRLGGTGGMPPAYQTAFHVFRQYRIPSDYLNYGGDNVIAVRVFDEGGEGGLVEGRLGLYDRVDAPRPVIDLAGSWQFRPGDDLRWRDTYGDKDAWTTLTVPDRWERQGFEDLDGFAWYRKQFYVPAEGIREDLVLLLGKIDDLDEVFLNGERIGGTGDIDRQRVRGDEWQVIRAYPIPRELLRRGHYNSLAVRVFDGLIDGGIFEGPIAIVTRAEAERWRTRTPEAGSKDSFWEAWFRFFKNETGENRRMRY